MKIQIKNILTAYMGIIVGLGVHGLGVGVAVGLGVQGLGVGVGVGFGVGVDVGNAVLTV